jgi:5-methyltetrahydropteroyltriglutamate--homocysteine methyltransferase
MASPRSTDHFLTSHVGSLPREKDLMQMMWAKEDGVPVDEDKLASRVAKAVEEIVKKQNEAGISIVNDGEMSKPSYATYIKDRLNGFGGTEMRYVFDDLVDFPMLAQRIGEDPSRVHRHAPGCQAPITIKQTDDVYTDIKNMQAATGGDMSHVFFSSASPGVSSVFFKNEYYPTHEEYVFAIADAMRVEYEAIAASGATLQIDCPDLAMGRHLNSEGVSLADFRRQAEIHIEALNHAVANIPADQLRMHLCWGNYGGPHHCDVPLADIIDLVMKARPNTILFEGANPRHAHEYQLFETFQLPQDKVLCPGVIEVQSNYVEHPMLIAQRIKRYADLVGPERVMAATDCGFSIHVGQASIDPKVAWMKLKALADGAAIASKWFFGR